MRGQQIRLVPRPAANPHEGRLPVPHGRRMGRELHLLHHLHLVPAGPPEHPQKQSQTYLDSRTRTAFLESRLIRRDPVPPQGGIVFGERAETRGAQRVAVDDIAVVVSDQLRHVPASPPVPRDRHEGVGRARASQSRPNRPAHVGHRGPVAVYPQRSARGFHACVRVLVCSAFVLPLVHGANKRRDLLEAYSRRLGYRGCVLPGFFACLRHDRKGRGFPVLHFR